MTISNFIDIRFRSYMPIINIFMGIHIFNFMFYNFKCDIHCIFTNENLFIK